MVRRTAGPVSDNQISKNVFLTLELDAFIRPRFALGHYRNADEMVRTAMCLLGDAEARLRSGRQSLSLDAVFRGR
jgi:Arc/MetJ-type ribon-helix-helix transcriptional regulator